MIVLRYHQLNNYKYLPTHEDHSPQSSQQAGASHERSSVFVDSSGHGKPPLLGAIQDLVLVLVPVPPQETEHAYKLKTFPYVLNLRCCYLDAYTPMSPVFPASWSITWLCLLMF